MYICKKKKGRESFMEMCAPSGYMVLSAAAAAGEVDD